MLSSNHEIETSITNECEGRKTVNVEQNGNRNVLLMILFILNLTTFLRISNSVNLGIKNVNGLFFLIIKHIQKISKTIVAKKTYLV